ncbi:MAG: hypothetical protein CVV34_04025, partial [Methanomicrobiales archaeon HGW-Methanomicrobiales-5]
PLVAGEFDLPDQFVRPAGLGGGVPVVVFRIPRVCDDTPSIRGYPARDSVRDWLLKKVVGDSPD